MTATTAAAGPPKDGRTGAEGSPFYTYAQAATFCNVERTTLYRAMKAGRLRASGPGSAVRFHRDDLDDWMRSRSRK